MSGDLRGVITLPASSETHGNPRARAAELRPGARAADLPSARRARYNGDTVVAGRTFALVSVVSLLALAGLGFEWEGRVARLRRALESPEAAERIEALRGLARHPQAEVRDALLGALADPELAVRVEAARAIGDARVVAAVPALLEWLADPDAELRIAAARALGAIGDPAALPSLVRALGDGRADVRRAAIGALAELGASASAATAPPGAAPTPSDAIVPLLARLDDTDAEVRVAAVDALVALRDPRSVVPLIARSHDPSPQVRAAVAAALGDVGDARAIAPLVQALDDGSADVQLAAIASLARIGDEDAGQALAIRAASSDERTARAATAALGRIPSATALAALLDALSRPELAPIAAEALRQRAARDGAAIPIALAAAIDAAEARSHVDALARALSELASETPIAPAAAALARALDESRGDPSIVLAALGASGDPSALVSILERLRAPDDGARAAAIDALGRWIDVAGPDGRAADPLLEALARGVPAERAPIARLLGRIGAERALPGLRAALDDDRARLAAVEAIGAIGSAEGAAPLVPLLDASDARVRHAAGRALGQVAGAEVLETLVRRVADREPVDRSALLLAIGAAARRLAADGALPASLAASMRAVLLELAAGPDRVLASSSLAALARAADVASAPGLIALAEGAPPARLAPVAAALASIDDDRARAATLELARGDGDAALASLSRLGEHGDRTAAAWLLESARTMPWPRAVAASFALARLARRGVLAPADAPALCALTSSRDPSLRANVAIALAALGSSACAEGPDPLRWMEPRHAALVRAAAARWAHAAAERGAIDAESAAAALARCARDPVPGPARDACRAPALPPLEDLADVIAWSADGRTPLPRTLLALRLPDGSVMVTLSDDAARIQIDRVPRGPLTLDRPATLPLEP